MHRVSQELLNRMKIEILISDANHPIMSYLKNWKSRRDNINIVHSSEDLSGGYILFLISCTEILRSEITKKFKYALVLHASDLPKGRGWSPHIWNVLEGSNQLTVSLLEADVKVDQGPIWLKQHIELEGHELFDEINNKVQTIYGVASVCLIFMVNLRICEIFILKFEITFIKLGSSTIKVVIRCSKTKFSFSLANIVSWR